MQVNFEQDFKENKNLLFYTSNYKVGLDIDECLADFIGAYQNTFGYQPVNSWYFSYKTMENLNGLKTNKEWWTNLRPLISPHEIPFMPHCYISKRNFPVEWTEEWLEKNGFPCVPVHHVESDKVEACKNLGVDYFIDDSILNFQRLNGAGVKTFLYDSVHNRQYDVGHYRLNNFRDLINKI